MRIIAGSRKGLRLASPKGNRTRPTMDRTKETLFNILGPVIQGSGFLDLFSGSGAIGLEAASRGADRCVLVEKDVEAARCIHENIRMTGFGQQARLLRMDFKQAFRLLEMENIVFDIVFMDPPFGKGLEKDVLNCLSKSSLLHPETLIVMEIPADIQTDYSMDYGFACIKERTYKTHKHVFMERGPAH